MTTRPIFRASAVEAHRRRSEKDVLPRLVQAPVKVTSWLLLALLVVAALAATFVHVPSYVNATGAIVGSGQADGGTRAVVFVSPGKSDEVRVGQPVRLVTGSSTEQDAVVGRVDRAPVGPESIRRRFDVPGAALPDGRSVVVTARLTQRLDGRSHAGSPLSARVRVGAQRCLTLLISLVRG